MKPKQLIKSAMLHLGDLLYGSRESKVIYYHDIHSKTRFTPMSTPLSLFEKHLEIIAEERFHVVDEIREEINETEITFDDGFRGLYENFSAILEHNVPVRVFLISDFIGQKDYLTRQEIEEMMATKLLKIGSHTLSHRNLDVMDDEEARKELCDSKKRLEDLFGTEIESICYPRGKFNDRTVEIARECGYEKQYSCLPGSYFRPFKPDMINRSLVQNAQEKEFRLILKGADHIFRKRYLQQQYRSAAHG